MVVDLAKSTSGWLSTWLLEEAITLIRNSNPTKMASFYSVFSYQVRSNPSQGAYHSLAQLSPVQDAACRLASFLYGLKPYSYSYAAYADWLHDAYI